MTSQRSKFTIAPDALVEILDNPDVRIVDASWYLPAQNRNAQVEYAESRIPGAVFFDIDAISDKDSALPHMLPAPEEFAAAVGDMGIGENNQIIVYDGPGLFSCARVWWTFRIMGAKDVRILDAGFDAWKAAGLPVETGPPAKPSPAVFNPAFEPDRVRSIEEMRAIIRSRGTTILDARPHSRFTGQAAEPRKGLRSGHIPGSKSLPIDQLVVDGKLKNINELKDIVDSFSLKKHDPVVTSCGSGVTAAIITLALESVGHANNALYDGSWSEWGQAEDAPVAVWDD
ncbi:MAG: 3-mercaptopyruvate sulfurtransferase [Pseudomonadota bacterium]